jgi:AraC-like DNA-binding protein
MTTAVNAGRAHFEAARVSGAESNPATKRPPLEDQILAYMRRHLTEPDLSAARIAAANNVSVRYLYKILSGAGITLGEWMRGQRLAGCHRDLARPSLRSTTVSSIASGWGFMDATHFSRVFRQAYGMSPREWRTRAATELSAVPAVAAATGDARDEVGAAETAGAGVPGIGAAMDRGMDRRKGAGMDDAADNVGLIVGVRYR